MELQKILPSPDCQNTLERKEQSRGVILPDFKMYYSAAVIKATWHWHKKQTCRDQWDGIENPRSKLMHLQPTDL